MAKWEKLTIKDALNVIMHGRLVLPIIQRELVWPTDKIISLFETVLRSESFGGIMTVFEPAHKTIPPLFEYRKFICDFQEGMLIESKPVIKLDEDTSYVIDGQQRLSAFLIGIKGSYNNEILYFDLLSEYDYGSYILRFHKDEAKLPKTIDNFGGTKKRQTAWYPVSKLYVKFEESGYDHKYLCDEICDEIFELISDSGKKQVEENLYKFQLAFFNNEIVGICGVPVNRKIDTAKNRLNIVKLFQKLNQGGTILNGLELMRSYLKAYNAENEKFLNEVKYTYEDIGFDQDEIIKFIFLLEDDHSKEISDIDQKDSDFIQNKSERIKKSLEATRVFLYEAGLYEYYKASRPSIIPLCMIAYHIFHKDISDEKVEGYFSNAETRNPDFIPIRKWLVMSLLNKTFKRGNGWDPNKTGRRKIFEVLRDHKDKSFPIDQIYDRYEEHPIDFTRAIKQDWESLNWYERNFVIYLIYRKPVSFRQNDIDHIHPKSILRQKGYEWDRINLLGNFQYLFYSDNRSKQDTELEDWFSDVFKCDKVKLNEFLKLHSIPDDSELWNTDRYEEFLEARRKIIYQKLIDQI